MESILSLDYLGNVAGPYGLIAYAMYRLETKLQSIETQLRDLTGRMGKK